MNLHGMVAGIINTVNPFVPITVLQSAGYTTNNDGERIPLYNPAITGLMGQIQPLTYKNIVQLEGLNIQGSQRAIYINGRINGLSRADQFGGDIITIDGGVDAGTTWLITLPLEDWPDWCKVAVTRQNQ